MAHWVFALCQPLVAACGPLVAVNASCGEYALLTEGSELDSFRATLNCEDASPPTWSRPVSASVSLGERHAVLGRLAAYQAFARGLIVAGDRADADPARLGV